MENPCPKPAARERCAAAISVLDAWARYSQRAPLYMPTPDDYSRPLGSAADYLDPDEHQWKLVEDQLIHWGAGGPLGLRHPFRKLLHWVHDEDGRDVEAKVPERFHWPLPGFTVAEVRYLLGMPPAMRARGDYEEFVRTVARALARA